MSQLLWKFDELISFTKAEEPEVRYWAVDRLVRHYPSECCDAIEGLLLDEHDATPPTVARHLGQYGSPKHHPILVRGFRVLRGLTPGLCLQALASLGYTGVVGLAADALKRGDLTEPALAIIVEALTGLGKPPARELVREYVARKVEILAEPPALRGVLAAAEIDEIPDTLEKLLVALKWRGAHHAGEAFRTVMDVFHIDDAGWCFRTGPAGFIELRKTIKAFESGYDCDIVASFGEESLRDLERVLRSQDIAQIARAFSEWSVGVATKVARRKAVDDLPERIAVAVRTLAAPAIVAEFEHHGEQFQQWLIGFQLSAAFALARRSAPRLSLKEARGNLDKLIALAEVETAFHLTDLPAAIAVVCTEDEARARQAQAWCLRMLESQGPFFPKVIALSTLGELQATHFIPEVLEYLSEENSYIYGAAERALSRMGEAIVQPAITRFQSGTLDPDASHSLLVLLCDLGTQAAYDAVVRHLDGFMDTVGPGTTAEWVSLFGTEELIEPMRDWLEEDPAMVGQGLLLLGAIHNVQIPEEDEIIRAIEDERTRQSQDDAGLEALREQGGDYVM